MRRFALYVILALSLIITACELFNWDAFVTGVTLDKSIMNLTVRDTETLHASITPDSASNKKVTWSSSNPAVATVSATGNIGKVTGVKTGTATITVTTEDGGKTAKCTIFVRAGSTSSVAVTGVTLNQSSIDLAVGGEETLYAEIAPVNATNKNVTWSSSNSAVATVSGGTVTGVEEGTAVITVTTANGGKTAECTVTVSVAVTGVTLDQSSIDLSVGDTEILYAEIEPVNATNKNVTWSSSDTSVATVDNIGAVTGVEEGTAVITVTTEDGGETAECTVTVSDLSIPESDPVQRVSFEGTETTVTLNLGSTNKNVYLVKVNTSDDIVSAAKTGGPPGSSPIPSPEFSGLLYAPENELPRMGHPSADEFNANPPPIIDAGPRRSRAVFTPPVVGDTRMFWVEEYYNNGRWVERQATLRATGQYGNIWVMDDNYGSGGGNKISDAQAQALSDKFDLIYPVETNLLGFEYGGGPGGDGGRDGDPKIQILVYDIVNASGVVQAAGFFWSKDFYEQILLILSGQKTNLAEIFYIDASQVNDVPEYIYSTLIHEFQHMINFNAKFVKQGKNSESWYNEMLSMMTEDIIAPLIGIPLTNSSHKIKVRMPVFLQSYYKVGITEWKTLESESYAKGIAFGAYLTRNYGGASLLKEILANNSANIASITAALKTVAGGGLSFEEAFRRFGEAMIFSGTIPANVQSFDKTVTKTIGAYTYTATGFDVWTEFGSTKPKIFGANEQLEIRPHSLTVHQDSRWKDKSGKISVTLQKPADSSVEFYLMVK